MKTTNLYKTSICLAVSTIASLKTYACAHETEKETAYPRLIAIEESIPSSSTSQTETIQNWEDIIKEQKILTIPQCKEAALHFYKENRISLSAELFRHYLSNKPLGDEPSFYSTAGRALQRTEQYKLASQAWDQYFHITPLANASDYLHAGRAYFFANRSVPSLSCFRSYTNHPDFEETSKIYLFETAEAYTHLGDFHRSAHFWNLYFARDTTRPTYFDYSNAAYAFGQIAQHEEAASLWKKAFALKKSNLDTSTFMSALISFNNVGDHKSMLHLLDKIEKYMPNPPSYIYRQAANIYLDLEKEEKAARMWDLFFLHPDSQAKPEDYASAARSYFQSKQVMRAYEIWEKYFALANVEFEERSYKSFALVLSAMGKYEESTAIWARLIKNKLHKDFLFHTIYARDLCALGRFKEATQQYDFCFDELIASKDDLNLIYATLAYSMTGNIQKASRIHNKRVAFGFLPSHMLIQPARRHAHSKPTKQKKSDKKNSSIGSDMVQSIKLSIGQTTFDQATKYYNQAKSATHPELQELRDTLIHQYNQCLAHFLALKKSTASKEPSTTRDTRTSSSQTSSSSSSSSTTETSTSSSSQSPSSSSSTTVTSTSSSSPLQDLQRTTTQMENTFALFERAHKKIQEAHRKQQYKELLHTFEQTPSTPFNDAMPAKKNLRSEYPRQKKERRTPDKNVSSHPYMSSSTSSSSSSSSSSSRSSSSSTSMNTPISMDVQWHITPAAEDQYQRLTKEQNMKFKKFQNEIEQNPYLDESISGTFSGKAKKLTGFSNLYSRRFDKKNRFVYRIEEHEGQIRATILGLLTHYKILERS